MTKVDPYLHAALLLHGGGKEISKEALLHVLKAGGIEADEAKAKVLADALKGANFEELLKASVTAAPVASAPAASEAKKEEKKDEGKTEAQAAEGLASLFG